MFKLVRGHRRRDRTVPVPVPVVPPRHGWISAFLERHVALLRGRYQHHRCVFI
jgi:hypothetical protein